MTEKLPLNSPGNAYIYCRSSEAGEIWPAIYEKAYAKWRTSHREDTPDINLIAGGDPVGASAQWPMTVRSGVEWLEMAFFAAGIGNLER